MKKKIGLLSLLALAPFILAGCESIENKEGFFYSTFVKPMDFLLEFFGKTLFDGGYGGAIIVITVIIRLILMPFMLKTYKNQQGMKAKMDKLRPEMEEIQKKLKATKSKEEQMALQQEMMGLYKKYDVNPLNMGCLPMIIQMPIIMGLYYAIRYSTEVQGHEFLWFKLGETDIIMTLIAGAIYFWQSKVSMANMPEQQQAQMKIMMFISPIMIMVISFSSMSALPLYWSVSGLLLVFQTLLGRKIYPPVDVDGNVIQKVKKSKANSAVIEAEEVKEKQKLTPAERAAKAQKAKKKK